VPTGDQAPVKGIYLSYGSGIGAGVSGIYFTSDGNPNSVTETCTVKVQGGAAVIWTVTTTP